MEIGQLCVVLAVLGVVFLLTKVKLTLPRAPGDRHRLLGPRRVRPVPVHQSRLRQRLNPGPRWSLGRRPPIWTGFPNVPAAMTRILAIEDDETTAREIVSELTRHGFDVEWSADGREGLLRAVGESFDAVTLDRMLPGVDGLTIVSVMRSSGIDTPVLMISALTEVDERVRGLARRRRRLHDQALRLGGDDRAAGGAAAPPAGACAPDALAGAGPGAGPRHPRGAPRRSPGRPAAHRVQAPEFMMRNSGRC
ncbi:MAG: response regulator [Caulobacteraceae bacterium]